MSEKDEGLCALTQALEQHVGGDAGAAVSALEALRDKLFPSDPPLAPIHQFVVVDQGPVLVARLLQLFQRELPVVEAGLALVAALCGFAGRVPPGAGASGTGQLRRSVRLTLRSQVAEGQGRQALLAVLPSQGGRHPAAVLPPFATILRWMLQHQSHATSLAAVCRLNGALKTLTKALAALVPAFEAAPADNAAATRGCVAALLALCEATDQNAAVALKAAVAPALSALMARCWAQATGVGGAGYSALLRDALQLFALLCRADGHGASVAPFLAGGGVPLVIAVLLDSADAQLKAEALTLLTQLMAVKKLSGPMQTELQKGLKGLDAASDADVRAVLVPRIWEGCAPSFSVTPPEVMQDIFVALMQFVGCTELPGGHYPSRTWKLPTAPTHSDTAGAVPNGPGPGSAGTPVSAYSPELCAPSDRTNLVSLSDAPAAVRHICGYTAPAPCCTMDEARVWAPSRTEAITPCTQTALQEVYTRLADQLLRPPPVHIVYEREDASLVPPPPCPQWTAPGLAFDSRFESGNLLRAVRVGDTAYDLVVDSDINSPGHVGQWFFFGFTGAVPGTEYTLTLVNMGKLGALFVQGQRPVVFSTQAAEREGRGWEHDVLDAPCYYRNPYKRKHCRNTQSGSSKTFYSLQFRLRCRFPDDALYCAYSQPYTHTELQRFLCARARSTPDLPRYCLAQTLATSLNGNACPLLTITTLDADPADAGATGPPVPVRARPVVVVSARVHPGETCASWMMEGVLSLLLDPEDPHARRLRDSYVWKVVPMLNPDGVVHGNVRCSLAGCDLNRKWLAASPALHPTLAALKGYLRHVQKEEGRPILLYTDLHGHARQKNIFTYGCTGASATTTALGPKALTLEVSCAFGWGTRCTPGDAEERRRPLRCSAGHRRSGNNCTWILQPSAPAAVAAVLPTLLGAKVPYFAPMYCTYKVQKSRESTGRVVAWREVGITLSYTVEASLCGGLGVDMLPQTITEWDPWHDDVAVPAAEPSAVRQEGHFHCQHYQWFGMALVKTVPVLERTPTSGGTVGAVLRELAAQFCATAGPELVCDEASEESSDCDSDAG